MIRASKGNAGNRVSPPVGRCRHAPRAVEQPVAQALLTGTWVDIGNSSISRTPLTVLDVLAPTRQGSAASCPEPGRARTHGPR